MEIFRPLYQPATGKQHPGMPGLVQRERRRAAASNGTIDGCMIKAVLELYHMNQETSYLEFADGFIDRFVNEDGSIVSTARRTTTWTMSTPESRF